MYSDHTQTLRFSADALAARIEGGKLLIEIPAIQFDGSILSDSAHDALRASGLNDRDIDDAVEDLVTGLMTKTLAAVLLRSRV